MKTAWRIIGVGCRIFVACVFGSVIWLLFNPPFGPVRSEFTERSGEYAISHFWGLWPEGISSTDVKKVSSKYESSLDSHVFWAQIKTSQKVAEKWQNQIHFRLRQPSHPNISNQEVEGVDRTITGPIPLHNQMGRAPIWWIPPSISFLSTEKMLWSKDGSSCYANALYSGFDPSTQTLWIYDYGQQHEQLWMRGSVPAGIQFTSVPNSSERTSNEGEPPG